MTASPVRAAAAAPGQRAAEAGFGHTPPQDISAEQCVLGGMLLSKDAIADVVEILRPGDFYRPVHATIFSAVIDLYGRGEPADPITVAAALADAGDLGRVGGAPYLHTLIASVPTAANAGYYARIVAERAVLRRLVEAGTKIVQLGYGSAAGEGRDVDDVVDLAQQTVYDVTQRRVSEDFAVLADVLQPTLDEIEAVGAQGGLLTGVPTGFTDLDRLLNGLHPGQLIIVAGRPGLGKALALDTPLPTPEGWTTMGQVQVGDRLLDAAGRPTVVTAASDVMLGRPCYAVEFSDGSLIVADGQHRWLTHTAGQRPRVRTTRDIRAGLRTPAGEARHTVPTGGPLALPDRDLPVAPYVLGVRLAAPAAALDPQVAMYVAAEALDGTPGAAAAPRIPPAYLRASPAQRRTLLAGLLDTAATVTRAGEVRFRTAVGQLAADVHELAVSLGYAASITPGYTVGFAAADDVFRLERKRLAHKDRRSDRPARRSIVDVRQVASVPVRCVTVDNDAHLYLAGQAMIPTHNSTAAMDFARSASIRHNLASAIFSLEMSKIEIVMRLLSAESRVPLHVLRSGQLSDDDWTRLARRMGEIAEAPLFVDDTPNMTLMEIRAKARRLRQRHDLKLLVVDYLQLMTSPKRVESRQQEVSDLSRGLKLLAKEVDCPVVAVSQLNRGPEQRTDKRPQLSDLRESGCLAADTTLLRADTGAPVTFETLLRHGHEGVRVWSLDEDRRLVARPITNVFASGTRMVYRLTLTSGRTVKATPNHRFRSFAGWVELRELRVGDRVAVPRRVPAPLNAGLGWPEHRVGLLAHLIGDGCVLARQPLHYTSQDEANLAYVDAAAAAEFGIVGRRVTHGKWQHTYLPAPYRLTHRKRNPIHAWFGDLGIADLRSYEKRIPDALYAADDREIRLFLRHLWATDGCVFVPKPAATNSQPRIYYATSSRALADGVMHLLSRLGLGARLEKKSFRRSSRPGYHITITGVDDMRRFCSDVGAFGDRGRHAVAYLAHSSTTTANGKADTLPTAVWSVIKAERRRAGLTEAELSVAIGTAGQGARPRRTSPSWDRVLRYAAALESSLLREIASDHIFWERVRSIEQLREEPVYDATVDETHNFVANGIISHNSIEQDSDVVVLLHRDDYYDKESERAGEADFIVAKHRNGPTDTVTVAAQLHLSRFVDMAVPQ